MIDMQFITLKGSIGNWLFCADETSVRLGDSHGFILSGSNPISLLDARIAPILLPSLFILRSRSRDAQARMPAFLALINCAVTHIGMSMEIHECLLNPAGLTGLGFSIHK